MNKDSEDKLTNAIITLHQEIKGMRGDLERHQAQTNRALGEMRLSYMKLDERVSKLDANLNERIKTLDDSFNRYADSNDKLLHNHETRVLRLEEKDMGSAYIVKEPAVKYRKGKKKR